mmetsp:Transcript_146172/g.280294  ORF Transcript_146172/g.280294 Transcript_146172/m.280294 type:complete len:294 (-) Transcript_146172:32-913(-)
MAPYFDHVAWFSDMFWDPANSDDANFLPAQHRRTATSFQPLEHLSQRADGGKVMHCHRPHPGSFMMNPAMMGAMAPKPSPMAMMGGGAGRGGMPPARGGMPPAGGQPAGAHGGPQAGGMGQQEPRKGPSNMAYAGAAVGGMAVVGGGAMLTCRKLNADDEAEWGPAERRPPNAPKPRNCAVWAAGGAAVGGLAGCALMNQFGGSAAPIDEYTAGPVFELLRQCEDKRRRLAMVDFLAEPRRPVLGRARSLPASPGDRAGQSPRSGAANSPRHGEHEDLLEECGLEERGLAEHL